MNTLLLDRTTNSAIALIGKEGGRTPVDPAKCRPRWMKAKEEKALRTKTRAEVFTPLWIVNEMLDQLDMERDLSDWQSYVRSTYLEITCGEAPFLVQLYEPENGLPVALSKRKGVLDRKLQSIPNDLTREEWKAWALEALKSVYGYEWQGDSLLIARKNVLTDFLEHYESRFSQELEDEYLTKILEIITWNLFQMDGLTYRLPKTEIPVNIMWWQENRVIQFKELAEE